MTVTIFPKFITTEECEILNLWTEHALHNNMLGKGINAYGKAGADNRYSSRAHPDRFDSYPDVAYSIYDRILKYLDLHGLEKSVNNGGKDSIIVNCTLPGGDVFKHIDFMEPNGNHLLRCNILTQPADMGGELFVNDNKISIEVGDLHCYLVTKYQHTATEVQGDSNRILWMFGYQISESDPRFSRWS
jgi:hypothetical protein